MGRSVGMNTGVRYGRRCGYGQNCGWWHALDDTNAKREKDCRIFTGSSSTSAPIQPDPPRQTTTTTFPDVIHYPLVALFGAH